MSDTRKDPSLAFLLELIPGFFQWFGWGHIYSGHILKGLLVMFSYWILLAVNFLLKFVLIGWVTFFVVWFLYLLLSPLSARRACR